MKKKNNLFDGIKIVVTGADGFIGSHLVEKLLSLNANVKALVYYNSWGANGWLSQAVSPRLEIVRGDVRDGSFIDALLSNVDYVFHLSSLIAIPYSYDAPRSYVDTNIIGCLNILEATKKNSQIKKLIHISTSEVYGTAQYVPIDENHPLVGQSPYSATKIAADKLAESYFNSFNLPVIIARPFNTYGPRQTARAVIPTIASQLAVGIKELKLGLITPTRDFNYVEDTVNGMIEIAKLSDDYNGQTINIGSGKEYSIDEVTRMLIEISGIDAIVVTDESRLRPAKSEVNRLLADNTLIKSITNWDTKTNINDGLVKTYGWVKNNINYFTNTYEK